MNDNDRMLTGCFFILLLVGLAALIYWRAENSTEFWVIFGVTLFGLFMLSLSLYYYANKEEVWGCLTGAATIFVAIGVGYFLFTGDFGGTLQRIGLATPTPIVVTATPVGASAATTPLVTPLPETPTPEPNIVAESTDNVDQSSTDDNQEKEVPWWQPDPKYKQTLTPQIQQWRLIALIIIIVQYLLILVIDRRLKSEHLGRKFVLTILSALLVFTVYGEWVYRLILWLFGFGTIGNIVVLIIAALSSLTGVGNLTALLVGGYLYYDWAIILWFVIPSIIVATFALIIRLLQVRGVRTLD